MQELLLERIDGNNLKVIRQDVKYFTKKEIEEMIVRMEVELAKAQGMLAAVEV